ncbi:amidase [Pollutimonas bauzanensis]|jgi:aspartyl-tRNA(Asn)/glutamyl-tRNA(Gln) amidotransferase subunit A|uniref:amidase n=1 Tax=Pollutimonas bauzanensis TaxID=658167 RepID=UPI00333EFD34
MTAQQLAVTLTGLRRQIVSGECSPAEALALQHKILSEHAPRWKCVTHIFPLETVADTALPLAGVGLAHKDIFALQGRAPECGTARHLSLPRSSGTVVRRLERAGSHAMAALSMAEFASGVTGENPNLPLPVNPVDPVAAVGGSSSGSAVAVAAGLCYGSLGTDTAGSIRIPAATCGVLGLKPTNGLLPTTGSHPLAISLDSIGILARSALDAAQILSAALTASQQKRLQLQTSLAAPPRWRIATCFSHVQSAFTPDERTTEQLQQFAKSYASKAHVAQVELATALPELIRCANIVLHVEAAAVHYDAMRKHGPELSDITRAVTLPGAAIPAAWYHSALQARRSHVRAFIDTYLRDHDLLLTPMLPQGVPDWDHVLTRSPGFQPRSLLGLFSWTAFVNYLGLPAIAFPIGQDDQGRPVCVQAIARPHAEALLLAFAYEAERERFGTNGFIERPPALRP